MDAQTQAQIVKVQKFSRYARAFCILLMVMLGLMSLWALRNVVFGPGASGFRMSFGPYTIRGDQFTTPAIKVWGAIVATTTFVLLFKGVFHLYALFGNFVAGSIYTKETVRHIRQLGLLAMAMAILQLILPSVSWLIVEMGLIDGESIMRENALIVGSPQIPGFITAGLLLLASWIMDVGRQTRDEAEEMRRDAELVV